MYADIIFKYCGVVMVLLDEALGILEKDYPNGKEAIAYIRAVDPRKFSRYALVLPSYGRVTSNVVECINATFLKLREYAARRLLFEVWIYVMRSFYKRRTATEGSIDLLTEYAKGRLSEFEYEYGSQAIPPITEQDLASNVTCRAPEATVRRGKARIVKIPNGGGTSRRHKEYLYPVRDEARLISSQGPLTTTSDQAAGPSTQDGRGKSQRSVPVPPVLGGVDPTVLSRQLSELLEKVSAPSVPLQVLESQQKTCEDLIDRLVEAGATIACLEAELNEGTKAKLTRKVPDRDWLHEAKQRWRANPSPENLFRLTEALEEHEDQIMVREKMFLKHARYLTVTVGDEEVPPDISRAAVVLCRRNDVLYG
ncbi:hypothetical protein R1flu_017715 [Riccia fluitans]|uniref:Uncharacterized protein n=1 Tax=Riccia fluitans TaxID=41844 RepID=A0ABD1ZDZ2_9MARC